MIGRRRSCLATKDTVIYSEYGEGNKFSQQEIADLEAYIVYLNGLERRKVRVSQAIP